MLTDAELIVVLATRVKWLENELVREGQIAAALADRLKLSHPERRSLFNRLYIQFGGDPANGISREDL